MIVNTLQNGTRINTYQTMNDLDNVMNIINNGNKEQFIEFAKRYNIFQETDNKFYAFICNKIKDRAKKDNIDLNLLRPEEQ